jgi:hypothetical protein
MLTSTGLEGGGEGRETFKLQTGGIRKKNNAVTVSVTRTTTSLAANLYKTQPEDDGSARYTTL